MFVITLMSFNAGPDLGGPGSHGPGPPPVGAPQYCECFYFVITIIIFMHCVEDDLWWSADDTVVLGS